MKGAAERVTHRIEGWVRVPARAAYLASLRRAAAHAEPLPPAGTVIVFAPHPDDETLACGGTIAARRAAGSRVFVVVMTDGAASRGPLGERNSLKVERAGEALAATSMLGLAPSDLAFLEYPDQGLAGFERDAIARVGEILAGVRPQVVFVPYRHDVHPDHEATNAIVRAALAFGAGAPIVYEYPVWFLHHWPLVDELPLGRVPVLSTLRWGMLRAARVLREFRCAYDVRPFLDDKRAALACYRSQTVRRIADPGLPTLADLSNGEFLALFLRDYELFRRVNGHFGAGDGNANA